MNTIPSVRSNSNSYGPGIVGGTMSPETMLLLCQAQLGDLQKQIDDKKNKVQDENDIQKQLAKLKSDLEGLVTDHESADYRKAKYDIIVEMKQLYDKLTALGDTSGAANIDNLYRKFCEVACNGHKELGYWDKCPGGVDPNTTPLRSLADWKLGEPYPRPGQKTETKGGGSMNNGWMGSQTNSPTDAGATMDPAAWLASINDVKDNKISDEERKTITDLAQDAVDDVSKGTELDMNDLNSLVQQRQMAVQLANTIMQQIADQAHTAASDGK